jgi:hypothetical protein
VGRHRRAARRPAGDARHPNHGSHLFVDTLLGQSDTIRLLARMDFATMQQILDIVAGFPGAIHLLPAPGFVDTGRLRDYYRAEPGTPSPPTTTTSGLAASSAASPSKLA